MYIKNLKVQNFRNIKSTDLFFNKKINFILGDNAQGKTNLIEAIYFSSFYKSFRSQKTYDLINKDETLFKIYLKIINNNVEDNLFISTSNKNKEVKLNGKIPENYNFLNVVIFHPDEVNYISSYPVFRRNLIDRSIFYTDFSYLNLYRKYNKSLKQRNLLLKNKTDFYDSWEDQLVDYGSKIIKKRIDYINKINSFFSSSNFRSKNSENYRIQYSRNDRENQIEEILKEEFIRKQERERQLGYTLVGPHKDDIHFFLNDRPAETFASQGQKRSLIISYKTAQILDYKSVHGHYPVLILDDMTSELDANRNNILLANLLENSGQVFITSTDFKQTDYLSKSTVFTVNNGVFSRVD
jgi:DNA replication and repair protein RecF